MRTTSLVSAHLLQWSMIAPSKHMLGQQVVIIGWYINLIDPRGTSIRPKLFHMLFGFDEMKPQPKEFWETLAGLVQRTAQGCWGWSEHTQAFHGMVQKCRPGKKDTLMKRFHGGKTKCEPAPASTRLEQFVVLEYIKRPEC